MASTEPPDSPARTTATITTTTAADDSPPPPAELTQLEPDKRVSCYVQAVDEMLDAVIQHEAFLFDEHELAALVRFRHLECASLVAPVPSPHFRPPG